MKAPKCKICGEEHWGSVCPKFKRARATAMAKARADEIAARPVTLGPKGKAKKAKKKAKK